METEKTLHLPKKEEVVEVGPAPSPALVTVWFTSDAHRFVCRSIDEETEKKVQEILKNWGGSYTGFIIPKSLYYPSITYAEAQERHVLPKS